jgi:hypothetical protein
MKTTRFLWVAVITALAFTFFGCSSDGGDDDDGGGGNQGGLSSSGGSNITTNWEIQGYTKGWPSANLLSQFGISGMPQPAGASDFYYRENYYQELESSDQLVIVFKSSSNTRSSVNSWITSNGWTLDISNESVDFYTKGDLLNGNYYTNPYSNGYDMIAVSMRNRDSSVDGSSSSSVGGSAVSSSSVGGGSVGDAVGTWKGQATYDYPEYGLTIISDGTVVLKSDGTFTETGTHTYIYNGVDMPPEYYENSGIWSQSGNVLTITSDEGITLTATVSGNTITTIRTDEEGNIHTSTMTRQ